MGKIYTNHLVQLNPLIMTAQQLDAEVLMDHCARHSLRVTTDTLPASFGHYPKHTTTAGAQKENPDLQM